MKGRNRILIFLLLVQLSAAVGLFIAKGSGGDNATPVPLIAVAQDEIDRITIDDGEGNRVLLEKKGAAWQLPDDHQLPADGIKVSTALGQISGLKTGWPVATTAAGRARFEVTEKKFQRRIRLHRDAEVVGEIYLGTSPGFRKVHARKADDDKVYALALNAFDFPAKAEDWLDRRLLRPEGEITELKGQDFHLIKKEGIWIFENQETKIDQDEAEKLQNAFAFLRIEGTSDETFDKDAPAHHITLKTVGKEIVYRFYEKQEKHYVRHPDYPLAFQISKFDYERITGFGRESLVQVESEVENEGETPDA